MQKQIQAKDINTIEILNAINKVHTIRMAQSNEPVPFVWDFFPNIPQKVVIAKLNILDKKGYVEYGGNVIGCWLSPKGQQMLEVNND